MRPGGQGNHKVVLNQFNGVDWKNYIDRELKSKRAYRVTTGDLEKPDQPAASDPPQVRNQVIAMINDWYEKDEVAQGVILGSISNYFMEEIQDCGSAKDMYVHLIKKVNEITVYSKAVMIRRIFSAVLREDQSAERHIVGIKNLAAKLKASGLELSDELVTCALIASYPASYNGVIEALSVKDVGTGANASPAPSWNPKSWQRKPG
jgi:hypothetical protein